MVEIPKFLLYGQNDPQIEEAIQPRFALRKWSDLGTGEKEIALQDIINKGWIDEYSEEILVSIFYLNGVFLRQCPGKKLHNIKPEYNHRDSNEFELKKAAFSDFQNIFLNEESEAMVLRMLSRFAQCHINNSFIGMAEKAINEQKKEEYIGEAFIKFDRFAICLNHIFDQFSVNVLLTRNGLIPKQDEKITELIYEPTLKILSDPKWKTVNDELAKMFEDFQDGNHPEVITKAHNVVHRFLQILVGEEGKSGKGQFGKYFSKAKKEGLFSGNLFTESIINVFQSFLPSERANKSSAKLAKEEASPSDALLMMNVVMIFLQHSLQNKK